MDEIEIKEVRALYLDEKLVVANVQYLFVQESGISIDENSRLRYGIKSEGKSDFLVGLEGRQVVSENHVGNELPLSPGCVVYCRIANPGVIEKELVRCVLLVERVSVAW